MNEARARQQRSRKQRNANPGNYAIQEALRKQKARDVKLDNAMKRRKIFLDSIRNGRIYVCICCHRKLYDNQVVKLEKGWIDSLEEQFPGAIARFIGPIISQNVCLPSPKGKPPCKLSDDWNFKYLGIYRSSLLSYPRKIH